MAKGMIETPKRNMIGGKRRSIAVMLSQVNRPVPRRADAAVILRLLVSTSAILIVH
jgi:hypothetical protein